MAGNDAYTKLLLHMDGNNGDTVFVDSSPSAKTVTRYTNATITTAESVFGGSSALFPVTGVGYLSVADSDDWYFGSDDFTIDFWIKRFVNNYTRHVWAQYIDGSNQIRLYINSTTNKLIFYVGYAGTPIAYFESNSAVLSATDLDWHHFALVRSGISPGCLKAYKDGILIPITTTNDLANNSMPNLASVARIGSRSGPDYFSGYLDELRISKGIARWTTNFTPPTEAYSIEVENINISIPLIESLITFSLIPYNITQAAIVPFFGEEDTFYSGIPFYLLYKVEVPLIEIISTAISETLFTPPTTYTVYVPSINTAIVFDSYTTFLYPSDYAYTWERKYPIGSDISSYYEHSSAISDNGQVMLVCDLNNFYRSLNAGITWNSFWPAGDSGQVYAKCLACNTDGSVILAGYWGQRLWKSVDTGNTWVEVRPAGDNDKYWNCLSVSSDGSVMVAGVFSGRIYLSINSGVSWSEIQPYGDINYVWGECSVSGDGSIIAVAIGGNSYSGRLFISNNTGSSWVQVIPTGDRNSEWKVASVSNTGQFILVGANYFGFYLSSDYGSTWSRIIDSGGYGIYDGGLSGDGQIILTAGKWGDGASRISLSRNYGSTWEVQSDLDYYSKVNCRTVAVAKNKKIFFIAANLGGFDVCTGEPHCYEQIIPTFEVENSLTFEKLLVSIDSFSIPASQINGLIECSPLFGWFIEVPIVELIIDILITPIVAFVLPSINTSSIVSLTSRVVQSEIIIPIIETVNSLTMEGSFIGDWIEIPIIENHINITFTLHPGWHEIRPGGDIDSPTSAYYVSSDATTALIVVGLTTLYRTDDSGETWQPIDLYSPGETVYSGYGPCAVSGNGQVMIVTISEYSTRKIFISRDRGVSWAEINLYQMWIDVSINYDGSIILVSGDYSYAGKLYLSKDIGNTWSQVLPLNAGWLHAVSGDGLAILAGYTSLYLSIDSGVTWDLIAPAGVITGFWKDMYLNYDGSVMLAKVHTELKSQDRFYKSLNSGITWEEVIPTGFVYSDEWVPYSQSWSCAISEDGVKLLEGRYGGRLYLSLDEGETWDEKFPVGSLDLNWDFVKFNGDDLLAIAFDGDAQTRTLYQSFDGGSVWSAMTAAHHAHLGWSSCAMSDDGRIMLAGGYAERLYLSTNSGQTWSETRPFYNTDAQWSSCAMSFDGQYMIAESYIPLIGPVLYVSNDTGDSWNIIPPAWDIVDDGTDPDFPYGIADVFCNSVSISKDGRTMLAAYGSFWVGSKVYLSTNYGVSWREVMPAGDVYRNWEETEINYNGSVMYTATMDNIYRSYDSVVWTDITPIDMTEWCISLSINLNGQIIYAGTYNGDLFKSDDFGVTWIKVFPAGVGVYNWYSVSMNSAASIILASAHGNRVYMSIDSGVTWADQVIQGNINGNWYLSALSDDGSVRIAGTDNNRIYSYSIVQDTLPIIPVEVSKIPITSLLFIRSNFNQVSTQSSFAQIEIQTVNPVLQLTKLSNSDSVQRYILTGSEESLSDAALPITDFKYSGSQISTAEVSLLPKQIIAGQDHDIPYGYGRFCELNPTSIFCPVV